MHIGFAIVPERGNDVSFGCSVRVALQADGTVNRRCMGLFSGLLLK